MSVTEEPQTNGKWVGQALRRKEDPRMITGRGRYVDDMVVPGMLYMAVVRSPEAHAKIVSIDASGARELPGVYGVFTGEDLDIASGLPDGLGAAGRRDQDARALAAGQGRGQVRRPGRRDRARRRQVRASSTPPSRCSSSTTRCRSSSIPRRRSTTPRRSSTPTSAPTRSHEWSIGGGDMDAAWAEADVVIERRIVNHRTAGTPIEPRALIADYRGGQLTLHLTSQNPHLIRLFMAGELEMGEDRIRVIAPDVGGGFGVKITHYPEEILAAWASRKLGRPIKWTETRSEHMSSSIHGRDQIDFVKVGAKRDGTIVGLECTAIADFGAFFTLLTPFIPSFTGFVISGCYKIPNLKFTAKGVFTNKMATDATRGAGRPEATHLIEVMVEQLAAELGMDPLELRRKNFIPKEDFPAEVAIGIVYDSGDYHGSLDKLLTHVDVDAFRAEQEELRHAQGKYRGIGFSTWMEICGLAPSRVVGPSGVGLQAGFYESAIVRVHASGSVTVYTGTAPHGQGLDTAFAQIVADRLGTSPDLVDVVHGDTGTGPFGLGTYGSRSLAVGGESIARATAKVVDKAKKIAAHQLEAAPEDIELEGGKFAVKGSPDKGMTLAEVAGGAYIPENLPDGHGAGARGDDVLRPGELRVPVRRARVHRRRRRGDREGRHRPLRRGRRLRAGDQPDADRRADPRRHHARDRPGAVRAHPLRRRRPARDRHVHRLRAAERRRHAELRDRPDGDPVAGQLARRQGRGRGGHDRRHPRDRQRGDRRAAPARRRHIDMPLSPQHVWATIEAAKGSDVPRRPGQAGRLVGRARERQRRLRTDRAE